VVTLLTAKRSRRADRSGNRILLCLRMMSLVECIEWSVQRRISYLSRSTLPFSRFCQRGHGGNVSLQTDRISNRADPMICAERCDGVPFSNAIYIATDDKMKRISMAGCTPSQGNVKRLDRGF
jgi:hypothetical protein